MYFWLCFCSSARHLKKRMLNICWLEEKIFFLSFCDMNIFIHICTIFYFCIFSQLWFSIIVAFQCFHYFSKPVVVFEYKTFIFFIILWIREQFIENWYTWLVLPGSGILNIPKITLSLSRVILNTSPCTGQFFQMNIFPYTKELKDSYRKVTYITVAVVFDNQGAI